MTKDERIKRLEDTLQVCRGALAHIALGEMKLAMVKRKALRVYEETSWVDDAGVAK